MRKLRFLFSFQSTAEMYVKIVIALIVLCCVVSMTQSEKSYDGRPSYGYKKKVKYGPPKYYGRPNRGYYYNPPDDYSARKPKVSKRPTNDGAGDINNIIKQLSKEDLDKIIEFAGEQDDKHTNAFEYNPPSDDFKIQINDFEDNKYNLHINEDENKIFKDFVQQFNSHDNYNTVYEEPKPFSMENYNKNEYKDLNEYVELTPPPKDDFKITFNGFEDSNPNEYSTPRNEETFNEFVENNSKTEYETVYDIEERQRPKTLEISHNPSQNNFNTFSQYDFNQPIISPNIFDTSIAALKDEESMLQSQIAYLQSQIKDGVVYTDSNMMPEEILPKPMNLRDEQETSFTNKVPTYVRADSSNSYKLENFGSLPLMDYNSKKDSLSSYHVPHYTVTSLPKEPSTYSVPSYSAPSPSYGTKIKIPVEAAPPASDAKYQSDAHLKAIKIWSHKSKGTAYTLHHDGSLSLEKPNYGVYGH